MLTYILPLCLCISILFVSCSNTQSAADSLTDKKENKKPFLNSKLANEVMTRWEDKLQESIGEEGDTKKDIQISNKSSTIDLFSPQETNTN